MPKGIKTNNNKYQYSTPKLITFQILIFNQGNEKSHQINQGNFESLSESKKQLGLKSSATVSTKFFHAETYYMDKLGLDQRFKLSK